MCGRYVTHLTKDSLGRWRSYYDESSFSKVRLTFNAAPTTGVPVWLSRGTQTMQWGLIPRWSREPKMTYPTFNARIESVRQKSSFREAWKDGQRCLLPAQGYYEWREESGVKQPYFVHRPDGEPLVFAGLWESWSRGDTPLLSCTIVTEPSQGKLQSLHKRMPHVLEPDAAQIWLHHDSGDAWQALQEINLDPVEYYPVSQAVGNVRNDDPALIQRIEVAPDDALEFRF